MRYSTTALQLSATLDFVERLKAAGYDIYWHETGEREANTREGGGHPPLDTITLVPDFPANPAYVVGLNSESPEVPHPSPEEHKARAPHEILIPAFTVQVIGSPRKLRRLGIGSPQFFRERVIQIDGFARNQFQHRDLEDLLYSAYEGDTVEIPIYDEEGIPLEPAWIDLVRVHREEVVNQESLVRYYVRLAMALHYVE